MQSNPYSPPTALSSGAPDYRAMGPSVEVQSSTVELLRQTRPWVIVMSILTFLGAGFLLLAGFAMMAIGSLGPRSGGIPGAALGAVYIPLSFLYIYPGIKLWSYAASIGRLLANPSQMELDLALGHQKSFWKFVAIAALVGIALYIFVIIGAVAVGVATRSH